MEESDKKKELVTFNESNSGFQMRQAAELRLFIMEAVIFASLSTRENLIVLRVI